MQKKIKFKFFKKIYNSFLAFIFFFINGKFYINNQEKNFIIDKKKIGKKTYKVFQIYKGKIFIDSSEEKYFYIKDNSILKKLSIDTKKLNNNSNIFKFGITKFLKKKNFNVISIISGRDAKNNYYHWLIDVLPRIFILSDKIKKNKFNNILVPNYEKKYQIESLKCFFIKANTNFINLSKNKYLQFSNIIFSSNNSDFEFYNYDLLKKLQNKILNYIRVKKIYPKNCFDKIYINRIDSNKKKDRFLINENELTLKIKKKGFKCLTLSNYSFYEQAIIFNNAKIIIGLHGAGLANILFAKKNTKIIELTTGEWPNMYYKLSKCLKLNYKKVLCYKEHKKSNSVKCSIDTVLSKI